MPEFEPTTSGAQARAWVLIVDPDESIRRLLATMLELQGHRGYLASTAEEALRICADQAARLDIVLIDHDLEGLRPADLARQCLQVRPGTRILAMSDTVDSSSADWADIPEFRGHLKMPFDLQAVAAGIHACAA